MPGAIQELSPAKEAKKLVLCFDGTGNVFQGNTSDTNVVKIYDKLDRDDDNQYHYYQPGIGTYDVSGGSLNKGPLGSIQSSISKTLDEGLATSFDAHVMAGYKFLMRYYDSGDKIYMFGFSRGAFTARFLSRMINTVGLLSKGNDEMVPFAYQLYQQYEQAKNDIELGPDGREDESKWDEETRQADNKLKAFTRTFCRRDKVTNADSSRTTFRGVKIYFLGIFDCVSSVKTLETPFGMTPKPHTVVGTAEHVRHAVAVDEFRVKFKAALLQQDIIHKKSDQKEDVKEVWFPGNHGDVGGGWPAPSESESKKVEQLGFFGKLVMKLKKILWTAGDDQASDSVSKDPFQASDIPLSWMIRELELIGNKEPDYALKWNKRRLEQFKTCFRQDQALDAPFHNTMAIGGGSSLFKVLFWNFMDYLPLFPRWELEKKQWKLVTFPANMASARDIPENALFHASLVRQVRKRIGYAPRNNDGDGPPVLNKDKLFVCDKATDKQGIDCDHSIYMNDAAQAKIYLENVEATEAKEAAARSTARSAKSVPLSNGFKTDGVVVTAHEIPTGVHQQLFS